MPIVPILLYRPDRPMEAVPLLSRLIFRISLRRFPTSLSIPRRFRLSRLRLPLADARTETRRFRHMRNR